MTTSFFYIFWCLHVLLEVVPISSSGHLTLLYGYFLKKREEIPEYIEHLFHIPTACIIGVFLWMQRGWLLNDMSVKEGGKLFLVVMAADIVTALCYGIVRERKRGFPLWLGFLWTMGLLFTISIFQCEGQSEITLLKASGIGLAQGIALLPGISRLAMTYMVGCLLGLRPETAFTFSLAIQLPLIIAAVVKAGYEVYRQNYRLPISIGGLGAVGLSSYGAYWILNILFSLMIHHATRFLAWYMIIPALAAFLLSKKAR